MATANGFAIELNVLSIILCSHHVGVSDIMAYPPTDLFGCPIECASVQIVDVSAFQPSPSMP